MIQPFEEVNVCRGCGKIIADKGLNGGRKSYCSHKCMQQMTRNKIKSMNLSRKLGLNSGETGQICEMTVTIDLIKKGHKVYLPFDTTAKFDLLAEKDGMFKRVQVKAGCYNQNGEKMKIQLKHREYDILAVVYNLNEIVYDCENLIRGIPK